MSVGLRPGQDGDVSAMASLRAMRWGDETYWVARIGGYMRGEHSPQMALPERAVFVAEELGKVVGFVAGHLTRRFDCEGELEWIAVVEQRRGAGIGQKLVRTMGLWFVEKKAVRICVDVDPKNIIARRLYAKCGAIALNEHWMVWEDAARMGAGAAPTATRHLY